MNLKRITPEDAKQFVPLRSDMKSDLSDAAYYTLRYEKYFASPNYFAIFFSTYTQVSPSLKPFSINNGKDVGLHHAYAT